MKLKKCIILLLIMIIISSINYTVKSASGDSYKVKMNADKTTLKSGDIVTISLKLDNIKAIFFDADDTIVDHKHQII